LPDIMKTFIALLLLTLASASLGAAPLGAAEVDFAHEVAPILKQHCGKCHAGDQNKGGLSLNTRETLLAGGESGEAVVVGKSAESLLLERMTTDDEDLRMPPEGTPVPEEQVAILARWIDSGMKWEEGFTFGRRDYEPPLKPRRPDLPPSVEGRENPVDRIVDAYLAQHERPRPQPVEDGVFARRVYLDLIGLLPTPEELQAFETDRRSDKRARLVQQLLARDIDYTEHWLTFWNDLLRNDYAGTGFITGGRKQITTWLYDALATNKPYDQFARELIAPPTPESAGFGEGIRWRGEVSAGQTVEIQFAQSVAQSFLGINLKCASCHDSFIDRWKLEESYGLAAIYSTRPLEIHRCDKPVGKTAQAAWLFPELGQVDAAAAQPERLQQLAALMTHSENGRFSRTIVNRLWHRLMGRGIVHPVDAMQTKPWNDDLLDALAVHLADNKYDLKKTLELIATSQAYQSRVQVMGRDAEGPDYRYDGPRAKRLTAEQFMDTVWQLTGAAPAKFDAPVTRTKSAASHATVKLKGEWIWSRADSSQAAAGEQVAFRKSFKTVGPTPRAWGAVACDNAYTLFVNGHRVHSGENWETPDRVSLGEHLRVGDNEIVIVARNGGSAPNPAGLFFEAQLQAGDGTLSRLASDASWQWTAALPAEDGQFAMPPDDWQAAVVVRGAEVWSSRVAEKLQNIVVQAEPSAALMVRASLLKSDFLMRSLGRPNRDQIVSVRPTDMSTLEAIDLSNGQVLADAIATGAEKLLAQKSTSPQELVRRLYRFALSREPSVDELGSLVETLGPAATQQGLEDVLWSVVMLPEFQYVR
jgi:hypothetical protein